MQNLRTYGKSPYTVAVVHGGPGAPGEMAPLARTLASNCGVLEPLQTAASVDGQVEELKTELTEYGNFPITLIGFSWGAWLSVICAAKYPTIVKKLILIGSGSFEEKYTAVVREVRSNRLSEHDRAEIKLLTDMMNDPSRNDRKTAFARFGMIFFRADSYDPVSEESDDVIDYQPHIFQSVWKEAAALRRSGELLKIVRNIGCPVTAIHGDYDPHPAEGVSNPLSLILKDFKFILLEQCGHKPWIERQAKDRFYHVLRDELQL